MSITAIENLLLEAMGLDSESIGSNTVQRIVNQRMRAIGAANIEEYFSKVVKNSSELQELIDAVTVPETWFFRDKDPFVLLMQLVQREWFPPSKSKLLRILSVPCATGEEPYSIAMILKDMGFDSGTVRVDAVDISMRALARARRAIYGANSFRGDVGSYLSRYFDKTEEGYALSDVIKSMVNIQHGNLLDDNFLSGVNFYDVIFCRNVLIYFRRTQQEEAVIKLHRILEGGGVLFVGHAEGGRLPSDKFTSMRQAGTFAFRKKSTSTLAVDQPTLIVPSSPKPLDSSNNAIHSKKSSNKAKSNNSYKSAPSKSLVHPNAVDVSTDAHLDEVSIRDGVSEPGLDEARRMADKGELTKAAEFCEEYISKNVISAEGYYLLGLIRQAEGKDSFAGELFRKVVYLNPRHYQALVHLAAQAELSGNWAAAAVYRSRASRVSGEDE